MNFSSIQRSHTHTEDYTYRFEVSFNYTLKVLYTPWFTSWNRIRLQTDSRHKNDSLKVKYSSQTKVVTHPGKPGTLFTISCSVQFIFIWIFVVLLHYMTEISPTVQAKGTPSFNTVQVCKHSNSNHAVHFLLSGLKAWTTGNHKEQRGPKEPDKPISAIQISASQKHFFPP